ncbi:MAG: hypothetical protein FJY91_01845 [Candidatus Harrisonbacteria bacterium]|nr:hypothetical protein [Candidatus Harrisonbacteria bacterium]
MKMFFGISSAFVLMISLLIHFESKKVERALDASAQAIEASLEASIETASDVTDAFQAMQAMGKVSREGLQLFPGLNLPEKPTLPSPESDEK